MSVATNESGKGDSTNDECDEDSSFSFDDDEDSTAKADDLEDWIEYIKRSMKGAD